MEQRPRHEIDFSRGLIPECCGADPDVARDARRRAPLVLQVVDGEDRRNAAVAVIKRSCGPQPPDGGRAMPVVRMHDVRAPPERSHRQVERRAAEEREPVRVVVVAVDRVACKQGAFRDEVDRHARAGELGLQDARGKHPTGDRHLEPEAERRNPP